MRKQGKPQKSGKQKKIKAVDPFYKGERVVNKNADKVNQRPSNPDIQEMPASLKELIRARDAAKTKKKIRRKKKKNQEFTGADIDIHKMEKGMTKPLKPAPKFKQGKFESDDNFLQRVERESQNYIAHATFEAEMEEKHEKMEMSKKNAKKKSNKNKERLQKKKLALKEKKQRKRNDRQMDFDGLKDKIEFGETVHQPPTLTAKPRKSDNKNVMTRPGRKSLLLKEVIAKNMASGGRQVTSTRSLGQTTKRKNMSVSEKRKMDSERDRAIDLYRQMKKRKLEEGFGGKS